MCLAIPGRIIAITGEGGVECMGRVDFGGVIKDIHLVYTPEAGIGDYVLVHVGFAIGVIDEAEAGRVFSLLRDIG